MDATSVQFHDLSYENDAWTCPFSGIIVEKDIVKNIEQREQILLDAAEDSEYQEQLWQACAESPLLFINLFGTTYRQFRSDGTDAGDAEANYVPMVTWPVQDHAVEEILSACGLGTGRSDPHSLILDKSRDMGASWIVLFVAAWAFIFQKDVSILVASRKEDLVDSAGRTKTEADSPSVPGNRDTLFWKLDCIIKHLPSWMQPRTTRTYMHMENLDRGNVIDGESTNGDLGRGGRRVFIFLDEAAAMEKLRSVDNSTSDSTKCRIFTSTPKGATYYSELVDSGRIKTFIMGWWDHPEKGGMGRALEYDQDKGETVICGPWRKREKRRRSMQDVSENIDIDHVGAGRTVFSTSILNRHMAIFGRDPYATGWIRHTHKMGPNQDLSIRQREAGLIYFEEGDPEETGQGQWRFWCDMVKDRKTGLIRPAQNCVYVGAADISWGQGASNSVIAFMNRNTGTKVAEYADAPVKPGELARIMAMAGLWFGGEKGHAFLIWEANGPGVEFGRIVARTLGYPWYYRNELRRGTFAQEQDAIGWWNDQQSNKDACVRLDEAYRKGTFVNPSIAAIEETKRWVRYENNKFGPGKLEHESEEAKATHGDRTRADMLLVIGADKCSLTYKGDEPPPRGTVERDVWDSIHDDEDSDGDSDEF
jgi:hypothetical protein